MMKRPSILATALAALIGLMPLTAAAITADDVVQAEVLPGWQTAQGTRMAALHLSLADHWKTYWRAPGDAGIPPSFDWSGSSNIARVTMHWPRPEVFHLNGMQSVGYMNSLVLPLEFTPRDPAQPMLLRAKVDIGVCNDICIPATLTLSADLAGQGRPDAAIRSALAEVPTPARKAGLKGFRCSVSPIKDGVHLTARIELPAQGPTETALFESADPSIWFGATATHRDGGTVTAEADMVPPAGTPFMLDRSKLTITLLGQDKAVELTGCPAS